MVFYAIGLGLADEKDITVKGLEIVKRAERVYLEAYTAILLVEKEVLVSRFQVKNCAEEQQIEDVDTTFLCQIATTDPCSHSPQ